MPGEQVAEYLAPVIKEAPVEVKLRFDQRRTVFPARQEDELRFDIFADMVTVNGVYHFAELELELRDGNPEALQSLGKTVSKQCGFPLHTESKFERGLKASRIKPAALIEGEDLVLQKTDRFVDAAYRVLRREFARFQWHEPGTRLGIDPECLHQMRVAARRLRSALRVFEDALPERRVKAIIKGLRWIGNALGSVRDLDVYLMDIEKRIQSVTPDCRQALDHYLQHLHEQHDKARATLLKALDSRRYARFVERVLRFLETGPPKRAKAPLANEPATAIAGHMIERQLKKVLRAGRFLKPSSPDAELHSLRIRFKRLRYAAEFFTDLYGGPVKKLARAAKRFQSLLGDHQDAVVAQEMIREYAGSARGNSKAIRELNFALGQLMILEAQSAHEHRKTFFERWNDFDTKSTRRPVKKRISKVTPPAPPNENQD